MTWSIIGHAVSAPFCTTLVKRMATTNTSSRVDNLERNQQRTQNKLDQTEQWLRMFIDSAEDYAIFSINPEGRIATWSRGAEKIFGYRPDEIVGQEFAVIFTEEDRAQ